MVWISQVDQYLGSFYLSETKKFPSISDNSATFRINSTVVRILSHRKEMLSPGQKTIPLIESDSILFSVGWLGKFIIWFIIVMGSGTAASDIDYSVWDSFIHN